MDESEKKYFKSVEESKRILEKSEKIFFDQLYKKKRHLDETEEQFAKRMKANKTLFESSREKAEQESAEGHSKKKKRLKNKIEAADHPVYFAILRFFSERGYKFDDETLKQYWELVTSITHLSESRGDSDQSL